MRKFLVALLFTVPVAAQPATTPSGEEKQLCRVWDGTDVALVDGSGNVQVTGTLTCDAGTGTFAISSTQLPAALGAQGALKVEGVASGTVIPITGTVTITDGAGAVNVIVDSGAVTTELETADLDTGAGVDTNAVVGLRLAKSGGSALVGAGADGDPVPISDDGGSVTVDGTVTSNQGGAPWTFNLTLLGGTALTGADVVDAGNAAFKVNCVTGCTAGGSFADASAFTFGTTAVSNTSFVVDDVATNTVAENSAGAARMNTNRILYIDLSQTAANPTAVKVDGSAVTQPVSGTVTVTDGSGALNVIVDSSALPTGAATAANQDGIVKDGAGDTTQANVSSGRLHVDGSGVTQPVSGTVNVGTFPDNEPINVAQMNGVAVTMGNGASGTGVQRVTIASDSTGQVAVASFPDNEPINTAQRGGVAVVAGACERETLLYVQIDQTSGEQLITGTASERIYICSIQLMTATAQNIALVDGTGSVCATGPTGLLGGSTAATGWNFAANGGIVLPPTRDSYTKTSTDADNVCLLQSSTGQVSGSLTYISIPNI